MLSSDNVIAMVAHVAHSHPQVTNPNLLPHQWKITHHRRARRIIMRYHRGMGLLTLPPRINKNDIEKFLTESLPWLIKNINAEKNYQPKILIAHQQVINIMGDNKKIVFAHGHPRVVADGNSLTIFSTHDRHGLVLKKYLWRLAQEKFPAVVDYYCKKISVATPPLAIRDPKSRWGSCIRKRHFINEQVAIMLSFRLTLAPSLVLAYLAAHEVCHLKESNHGKNFWQLVEDIFPDYNHAERWLKKEGKDLMDLF